MKPPIVDVPCHVFNAEDLPVRGFVQHLHLDTPVLGPMLSILIDRVVQGGAPGFERDIARIQALLARGGQVGQAGIEMAQPAGDRAPAVPLATADEQADAIVEELLAEDPAFVRRLSAAVESETGQGDFLGEEATAEGLVDRLDGARRAVKWAKLFAMSRLDVARELVANFDDEVDLFCPLLVDLGVGLGDQPRTTMRQQVELLEGISVLSMRGDLPGGGKARLHPFVGFDPRRQVRSVLAGQAMTPLDVVREAVTLHGFLGVKVYPPMGWLPLGNSATVDMTAAEADVLDRELTTFYQWCVDEDVPITAHANRSNYADKSFAAFPGPTGWARVIKKFPELKLNLGHFGGAKATTPANGWPHAMTKLAVSSRHVYADTGNHRIDDPAVAAGYLNLLETFFDDPGTSAMDERLMYGSDWFMLAILPEHHDFLRHYKALFEQRFTPTQTTRFMGGNAMDFLGLSDTTSKSSQRLRTHYSRHAPGREPKWLDGVVDD